MIYLTLTVEILQTVQLNVDSVLVQELLKAGMSLMKERLSSINFRP